MPDPLLPGRLGLYLSMFHYGLRHNRDFAHEHFAFFESMRDYLGPLAGERVLDVGCGKSFWLTLLLHSAGARATGIDTEAVRALSGWGKYRAIAADNGIERALRTLAWDALFARPYYRELARCAPFALSFEGIDVRRIDGQRWPVDDEAFDKVVSHEVFEHIGDLPLAAREVARVLRPGGRTYIYVHNFCSLSGGHHIAWKYPDSQPSRVVPPWDHLRERRFAFIPSWLNEKREAEYREIFSEHLEILDWFSIGTEGEGLLTHEIRAELDAYSEHELLSKGFVIVGQPRAQR